MKEKENNHGTFSSNYVCNMLTNSSFIIKQFFRAFSLYFLPWVVFATILCFVTFSCQQRLYFNAKKVSFVFP